MIVRYSLMLSAALVLASCGQGKDGKAPSGQVVATVDGQEITASQLRLEMGDAPSDPAAAAAAQQGALQSIVNRKLLVAAAKDRKLDDSPLAAMVKDRAGEMALVQLLQMNLAGTVPKVSDSEVAEFVSSHPATFSQRKLISVDLLIVPQIQAALVKQMEPLDTLEQIKALLDANKVRYLPSAQVVDTLNVNPDAAARIATMNTNDVFVSPAGSGVAVSRITGSETVPLTGAEALGAARIMLAQQRSAAQVNISLEQLVKNGQSKVKINPQYQAKPAAPAAGAAASPAAGGDGR